jgi:2'-hydroxyisoflavone reductase
MKKTINRRKFIAKSLSLAMGFSLIGTSITSNAHNDILKNPKKKLKILLLGGTSFLGPHQIKYALDRGHSVSTFTRGKTKPVIYPEMFNQVESLIGDRNNDLTAIQNRKWDVVIDNSGRNSNWTRKSAQLLKDNVNSYMYISSVSVYYPYLKGNADENSHVLMADPIKASEDSYGVMKAKSEQETINAFGKENSIIIRPTFMIGPADMTNRFIHWPIRLARGGDILVPGKDHDPVQYADVRDVAEWSIRLCENKVSGTYNAAGPENNQVMGDFISQIKNTFDNNPKFITIDDYDFLEKNNIHHIVPWLLPSPNYFGTALINNEKAINSGLTFRDVKETVRDTHQWWYSNNLSSDMRNKYEKNPQNMLIREAELLVKWEVYKT